MKPDANIFLEVAIEPGGGSDAARNLASALGQLEVRDPSLCIRSHEESGQFLIGGNSERQLEAAIEELRRELGAGLSAGSPQAIYRESVVSAVEVDYCHKKQSGDWGEFARVKISVEPAEPGSGLIFVDAVKNGNLPPDYVAAVERGIGEMAAAGSLFGFPLTDLTVTIFDGAFHDVDSSPAAFEIAGMGAMREAASKAGSRLLEPIVKLVILSRVEHAEKIRGETESRGASIAQILESGGAYILVATSAVTALFGIEAELETLTGGQAKAIMQLDHFAPVAGAKPDPDESFPMSAALRT